MGKLLVIVEFLVKVKIINKYLGKDFIVKFSVGYVCDFLILGLGKMKIVVIKMFVEVCKMLLEEKVVYKK